MDFVIGSSEILVFLNYFSCSLFQQDESKQVTVSLVN